MRFEDAQRRNRVEQLAKQIKAVEMDLNEAADEREGISRELLAVQGADAQVCLGPCLFIPASTGAAGSSAFFIASLGVFDVPYRALLVCVQVATRRQALKDSLHSSEGAALKETANMSAIEYLKAQVADALASSRQEEHQNQTNSSPKALELLVAQQRHEIEVRAALTLNLLDDVRAHLGKS